MSRQEVQLYTREQVAEHVRDALAIVEEAGTPDDLRAAVFTEAVRLLGQKHVNIVQPTGLLPAMALPRGH